MKCTSLEEVRANIDRIDDDIIKLIAERTDFVRQAVLFKKDEEGVKAPDRVKAVLERVNEKAVKYGAPADITVTVYRNMISGFVNMELDSFNNDEL